MKCRPLFLAVALLPFVCTVHAWDYEGHRLVNEVALAALPADFPGFVRAPQNAERIAFLAGEPDRWRNDPDLPLQQLNEMDHYLDVEDLSLAGLDPKHLPSLRLDFDLEYAAGRAAHASAFPPINPAKNAAHTREWCGTLPWAVTEYFGKLRSAFSYLRVLEELGTPVEIANARANIVDLMGVMGHYVGDGSQPLHTTMHHHGWVGPNPHHFTTWPGVHALIDGFPTKTQMTLDELRPRIATAHGIQLTPQPDGRDPMFVYVMNYVLEQNKLVVPLYRLEKAGELGGHDRPIQPEGHDFIAGQIVVGGEMLSSIWVTAWRTAVPDSYLRNGLLNRRARETGAAPASK